MLGESLSSFDVAPTAAPGYTCLAPLHAAAAFQLLRVSGMLCQYHGNTAHGKNAPQVPAVQPWCRWLSVISDIRGPQSRPQAAVPEHKLLYPGIIAITIM
ncbi:hypothetical protein ACJQWK_11857 [Exserohilum turcicum]